MSACHTVRIASVAALAALIGFATPADAALTTNAVTSNGIHLNGLVSNALSPSALAPAADQLDELNGVVVEGVALPAAR